MFYSFAISPSQCVTKGSAEQSTYTFLVNWLAYNLLIALPALSTQIILWFSFHVSFICNLSIPVCSHRLSRATMDQHPKMADPNILCAKSKLTSNSLAGTHSCLFHSSSQNQHYPVQTPPTSHLN